MPVRECTTAEESFAIREHVKALTSRNLTVLHTDCRRASRQAGRSLIMGSAGAAAPLLDSDVDASPPQVTEVTHAGIFHQWVFLGWTAFGGPSAHIGIFRKVPPLLQPLVEHTRCAAQVHRWQHTAWQQCPAVRAQNSHNLR